MFLILDRTGNGYEVETRNSRNIMEARRYYSGDLGGSSDPGVYSQATGYTVKNWIPIIRGTRVYDPSSLTYYKAADNAGNIRFASVEHADGEWWVIVVGYEGFSGTDFQVAMDLLFVNREFVMTFDHFDAPDFFIPEFPNY